MTGARQNRELIASGPTIGLRRFDVEDAAILSRTLSDLDVQRQAFPSLASVPNTATIRRRLASGDRAPMSGVLAAFELAIVVAESVNLEAIGVGGYYRIDDANRNVEIGVSIADPRDRGKGFGKEAHLVLISYAFECLQMHRVYGQAKAENHLVQHLVESLGMVREGTLRDHRCVGGTYQDVAQYGVLHSEWSHRLTE